MDVVFHDVGESVQHIRVSPLAQHSEAHVGRRLHPPPHERVTQGGLIACTHPTCWHTVCVKFSIASSQL